MFKWDLKCYVTKFIFIWKISVEAKQALFLETSGFCYYKAWLYRALVQCEPTNALTVIKSQ